MGVGFEYVNEFASDSISKFVLNSISELQLHTYMLNNVYLTWLLS